MRYLFLALFLFSCAHQPQVSSTKHVTQAPPVETPAAQEVPTSQELTPSKSKIQVAEVTKRGNFFRIDLGSNQGIKMGEPFVVLDQNQREIARAEVVALRPTNAFLRVNQMDPSAPALSRGQIVRRLLSP